MAIRARSLVAVNAGACAFCFLVVSSSYWGMEGYDVGNSIANERIIAELVGVSLATIGVTIRSVFGSNG